MTDKRETLFIYLLIKFFKILKKEMSNRWDFKFFWHCLISLTIKELPKFDTTDYTETNSYVSICCVSDGQ